MPPGVARGVPPNMTVLAQRVHRTSREDSSAFFGAQWKTTWASVDAMFLVPSALRGSGSDGGASMGNPGRATRVHQGATVLLPAYSCGCNGWCLERPLGATDSDQRAFAGATVGDPSVLRISRNPSPGCPSGIEVQGAACSFGQDGPRFPTPFAVFEITDDRWVSGGLSPSGFELFGSGSDRPFGMTILSGRTFERLRSWRKAVIDWRSNGRRVTGTERCTAPREGKAL